MIAAYRFEKSPVSRLFPRRKTLIVRRCAILCRIQNISSLFHECVRLMFDPAENFVAQVQIPPPLPASPARQELAAQARRSAIRAPLRAARAIRARCRKFQAQATAARRRRKSERPA
ncbi:hypothetical protein [Lysobacter sp. TAB13]|uniref:hypothetical protein n=1 Tax=Lysobacter sp. TAB13 TaxID=3233065 RepID=UPI003F9E09E7